MNRLIADQQELAKWVREQGTRLDLAVAFWGDGAISELGLRSGRKARILLDLSAGATNPTVAKQLLDMKGKVQVKQRDRLHAKLYLGDASMVIGSANASANGLGAEGHEATHWCELGILTDCRESLFQAEEWFEKEWLKGRPIEPTDLAATTRAWVLRRRGRPMLQAGTILEIARHNPEQLIGRNIYLNVCTLELSRKEDAECRIWAKQNGAQPFYFYCWDDIPLSAKLISFTSNQDGSNVQWDYPKVCRTPSQRPQHRVVLVQSATLDGLKLGSVAEWRKRIQWHARRNPRQWRPANGGLCMDIVKFVRETNAALE